MRTGSGVKLVTRETVSNQKSDKRVVHEMQCLRTRTELQGYRLGPCVRLVARAHYIAGGIYSSSTACRRSSSALVRLALRHHTVPRSPSLHLLLLLLLHLLNRLLRELLPEQLLHDILLPRPAVADHDQYAPGDIASDRAAEDHRRERKRAHVVIDPPGAGAEGNLEKGVEVQDDDDCDEEAEREGVVGESFVGFVEGVGFGEFGLVVHEAQLLDAVEDGELELLVSGRVAELDVDVHFLARGEVVFVLELGEGALPADFPG